mmetsp:Transcript_68921/g.199583  ORF Transcript_68921/g.199583 Transcript_68921/m.199583 type:complete len:287 (-) Transcript_68921:567-1427(-)
MGVAFLAAPVVGTGAGAFACRLGHNLARRCCGGVQTLEDVLERAACVVRHRVHPSILGRVPRRRRDSVPLGRWAARPAAAAREPHRVAQRCEVLGRRRTPHHIERRRRRGRVEHHHREVNFVGAELHPREPRRPRGVPVWLARGYVDHEHRSRCVGRVLGQLVAQVGRRRSCAAGAARAGVPRRPPSLGTCAEPGHWPRAHLPLGRRHRPARAPGVDRPVRRPGLPGYPARRRQARGLPPQPGSVCGEAMVDRPRQYRRALGRARRRRGDGRGGGRRRRWFRIRWP